MVNLGLASNGQIFAKCQVTDYCCRGDALSSYNVLDFFVDTYEGDIDQRDRAAEELGDSEDVTFPRRVRPRNNHIRYLENQHPKFRQKQRILRSHGHRNLPNFIAFYRSLFSPPR